VRATAYQPINKKLSVPGETEVAALVDRRHMMSASKINVTVDKDAYVAFDRDGTLDASNALELKAGESYSDDDVFIGGMISFVNKNADERPTIRGIMWGN
jgi:hypothetical protein